MIKITPDEFKVISRYIQGLSGIHLDNTKSYLVETRLNKIVEELGCSSYSELYSRARSDRTNALARKIIDAISTHETLFFRDTSPFEVLQHKILPDLIDRHTNRSSGALPVNIRIWSAACSTGQEIYSIAIVLKELLGDLKKFNIKLLGTDISDVAVARASYGAYNKFEIERGLPPDKLERYFRQNKDGWKIKDKIRAMTVFKKFNLMLPFSSLGEFDIVFCRNVAIYFEMKDRKKLFEKIAQVLAPNGYLITGSSESLTGICPEFEPKQHLRSIFYQLKG